MMDPTLAPAVTSSSVEPTQAPLTSDTTTSPIVQDEVPIENQNAATTSANTTAIMCCDPNGLCLGRSKGASDDILDTNMSGSYTAIMRLASQLQGKIDTSKNSKLQSNAASTSSDGVVANDNIPVSAAVPTAASTPSNNVSADGGKSSLLVSIETDVSCTLLKEYDAHTVVLKVPLSDTDARNMDDPAGNNSTSSAASLNHSNHSTGIVGGGDLSTSVGDGVITGIGMDSNTSASNNGMDQE